MESAELLQGEDLKELQDYLASTFPALLGLEAEGEGSAEAFREVLSAPDVSKLLGT